MLSAFPLTCVLPSGQATVYLARGDVGSRDGPTLLLEPRTELRWNTQKTKVNFSTPFEQLFENFNIFEHIYTQGPPFINMD